MPRIEISSHNLVHFLTYIISSMSTVIIGVLALQGAFAEHITSLRKFDNVIAKEIRTTADMQDVDALILPGGESTVQGKWLAASDLGQTIRDFCQKQRRPTWGTCAGMILLANRIKKVSDRGLLSEKEGGQYRIEGMNIEIERNYFGRQINSFEAHIESKAIGNDPFHAVFIRAPAVHEDGVYGKDVEVLASVEHEGRRMIVAVQEHNLLGTAFHPELTTDNRWHEYFVQLVTLSKAKPTIPRALVRTSLPDLQFLASGKVRDIYSLGKDRLLFVTTDRVSAYDVIMTNGVPDKGKILTALSEFWFSKLASITTNHLLTTNVEEMPEPVPNYASQLAGRSMLVRKLQILPIEAIVRGYITGSAWKEYKTSGTVHGIDMPTGLRESEALPEPLFTPSTKAEQGDHDENIHPSKVAGIIGAKHAKRMEELALTLYTAARDYAVTRGIIIADTKFEFGLDENDEMVLVDEVLTPDSSRFWPANKYQVGCAQESFDKQYLRDYLTSNKIDKKEGVTIPDDVIAKTQEKYAQVYTLLTGNAWK